MIRKDVDDMIDFLNELFMLDPNWVSTMVDRRLPCNKALADHRSVQVASGPELGIAEGQHACGLLGMLNGYYGVFGDGPEHLCGAVAARYDDANNLTGFERFKGRKDFGK